MRKSLKVAVFVVFAAALPSVASARATFETRAAELSRAYLHAWSSNGGTTLARVKQVYAPQVRFYSRMLSHTGLYSEKKRFAARWPIRRYTLAPNTVRVSCAAAQGRRCTVTALIHWRAEDPGRRALSRGFSRFAQTFDFSAARPLVVAETGAVVSSPRRTRGRNA